MADSFIGSGDLYIARLNSDGTNPGFQYAGNATKFEITPDSELKEQTSKSRTNYGQVIASAVLPKPSKIAITLNQMDTDVMSMALFGSATPLNVGAGTVTDESITALAAGKYADLAKRNLTAESVVVTDATGTTTYVEGTDYTVQYRLGMIAITSGGSITAGDTILVDYGYAAEDRTKILGGTQPIIKVACRLDGENYVDGGAVEVIVWEARLRPTTPIDFLGDDFGSLNLEGTLLLQTGKSSTFEILR